MTNAETRRFERAKYGSPVQAHQLYEGMRVLYLGHGTFLPARHNNRWGLDDPERMEHVYCGDVVDIRFDYVELKMDRNWTTRFPRASTHRAEIRSVVPFPPLLLDFRKDHNGDYIGEGVREEHDRWPGLYPLALLSDPAPRYEYKYHTKGRAGVIDWTRADPVRVPDHVGREYGEKVDLEDIFRLHAREQTTHEILIGLNQQLANARALAEGCPEDSPAARFAFRDVAKLEKQIASMT